MRTGERQLDPFSHKLIQIGIEEVIRESGLSQLERPESIFGSGVTENVRDEPLKRGAATKVAKHHQPKDNDQQYDQSHEMGRE